MVPLGRPNGPSGGNKIGSNLLGGPAATKILPEIIHGGPGDPKIVPKVVPRVPKWYAKVVK